MAGVATQRRLGPLRLGRARSVVALPRRARCVFTIALTLIGWPAFGAYMVQQGDTIEVAVVGLPELRQRLTVQADGAIDLPLAGAVAVEGLTPSQLRLKIQNQLARKIYRLRTSDGREVLVVIQPDEVSAAILEYRPIYVTGDVARPGELMFRPEMTARQALALAGGTTVDLTRLGTPFLEASTLKGEHETLLVDLAKAAAHVARVYAELNDQDSLGDIENSDLRLPKKSLTEIESLETGILQARLADYRRQLDFLRSAVSASDERSAVVAKQQQEEEEGTRADTAELQKLVDLLHRGAETSPRVNEARRALLLSSTRTLQVNVELLDLKKQKTDSERALQQFEDSRRIELLKELQDAVAMVTTLRIKRQTIEAQLGRLSNSPSSYGPEDATQLLVTLVRQTPKGSTQSVIDGDFVLAPGDVLEVSLRAPDTAAAADPTPR